MKIELPRDLVLDLLESSHGFRLALVNQAEGSNLVNELRSLAACIGNNKIAVIKAIRAYSEANKCVQATRAAFPDVDMDGESPTRLSLREAKHLAEYLMD